MKKLCQSCSMPLDETNNGTNSDGSKSHTYCELCYKDGNFVEPDLTVEQMQEKVKVILQEKRWPRLFIYFTVKSIPRLERWRS